MFFKFTTLHSSLPHHPKSNLKSFPIPPSRPKSPTPSFPVIPFFLGQYSAMWKQLLIFFDVDFEVACISLVHVVPGYMYIFLVMGGYSDSINHNKNFSLPTELLLFIGQRPTTANPHIWPPVSVSFCNRIAAILCVLKSWELCYVEGCYWSLMKKIYFE